MKKIGSCLWFNGQAEEAAKFYTSAFKNSKIGKVARYGESAAEVSGQKVGSVMTVEFEIEGQRILCLNGGPQFKFTPSFSYFVWCENEEEIDNLWQKLAEGGEVRMGLDKYPWATKYGWTKDRFGVEWQVTLSDKKLKIAPAFLFVDKMVGKGEEAINFYMSLFPNSKVEFMKRDEANKSIMHCVFSLNGQEFVLMEGQGTHGYTFSPAFSLVVHCENQEEINGYWKKLSKDGSESQCGWLTDKYGVSWQVVPSTMGEWMTDSKKSENVMRAVIEMKKLDMARLKQAYERG